LNYKVTAGFSGELQLQHKGLLASEVRRGAVATGTRWFTNVTIPAGTMYARFRLYGSDVLENGVKDAELYLFKGDDDLAIKSSATPDSSDEMIHIVSPDAGEYQVMIVGRDVATDYSDSEAAVFLHIWTVTDKTEPLPNLQPANTSIALLAGVPATVQLRFAGLKFTEQAGPGLPSSRYLGNVEYLRDGKMFGYTLVVVDA
jgi:hypothetical protein